MKIYVAYKHLGEDEARLKMILEDVAEEIRQLGHESFIYLRDIQKWGEVTHNLTPRQLILKAFEQLNRCDAILVIVDCSEKSEGMLLEIGYAKALGKKILLAVDKSLDENCLRFVRGIADCTIEFNEVSDLKDQIKSNLRKILN